MERFYLVVHGSTQATAAGLLCGSGWDVPLNDEGMLFTKRLSRQFAPKSGNGLRGEIGVIFSSPQLRCVQTADILHDVLGVKLRVISGLAERSLGALEKSKARDFQALVESIPGGESLAQLKERATQTVDFVLSASPQKAALLVTHEFFSRALLSVLSISDRELERCKLYRFEMASGAWRLEAC